ncbi:Oxygen sensor protein DosP [compost metagenome]
MAHALSLRVSAEGVETALAFDFVTEIGCEHVQGDFIAKPMPASELEGFVATWNAEKKLKSAAGR